MATSDAPLFVLNPTARNGAAGKRWPGIAETARSLGLGDDVVRTERAGHAAELVRDALGAGRRRIVVIGGDGTVNEAVNGFFDPDGSARAREAELAIVAIGTGRDGIRTYGIPKKPADALRLLVDGTTRTVDVGRATFAAPDGPGARVFLNVGSCGLTGAVADRASRTSTKLGGTPAFLYATVATFVSWKNVPFRVETDGTERSLVANNVVVANGQAFGGGIQIAPEARPDDGLFDVLVWGDVGKVDLARTLHKLYRGTHLGHPKLTLVRASSVRVEPERPLPIELDGELPGRTPVRFDVLPGALRLRVPRTA